MFALMWGVGALLELDDRAKMEEFLVKHGKLPLPDINEDSFDTIFEFVVDDCGKWAIKSFKTLLRRGSMRFYRCNTAFRAVLTSKICYISVIQ